MSGKPWDLTGALGPPPLEQRGGCELYGRACGRPLYTPGKHGLANHRRSSRGRDGPWMTGKGVFHMGQHQTPGGEAETRQMNTEDNLGY